MGGWTMEYIKGTLLLVLINSIGISVSTFTCPSGCNCRPNSLGQTAVYCLVGGWTSFPSGLDNTVNFLYVSGRPSNQNNINSLKQADIQSAANIQSLVISYSKLRTIENGAFSTLSSLRDLMLTNNEIQSLSAETFSGMMGLRTLDLSGNKECQFDKSMFNNIQNIEELNLGDMALTEIPGGMFDTLAKLKVLKLHLNNIKRIRDDFITGLPSLQTLDLNGNLLRRIPSEWKTKFETMEQVHLSENPLQCNCQLLWLRELPVKFYASRIDTSHIVCNGPNKIKYQPFTNVPEEEFICIPPQVVKCEKNIYPTKMNENIVITCEYKGDPIPEISWTRPDGFVIDGTETIEGQYEISENGSLVINGISMLDDGNWKVTAYNKTAHDDKDIEVQVIVTTTSTSTQPTTKPLSTIPTASGKSSTILSTLAAGSSTTRFIDTPGTRTTKRSIGSVNDNVRTVYKEAGINWGLLVAAAAGGGTIVGVIFILSMCCKKKQQNENANQVEPFELDAMKY